MNKPIKLLLSMLALFSFFSFSCYDSGSSGEPEAIDFTKYQDEAVSSNNSKSIHKSITLVKLRGKIVHFGYDLTQSPPAPIDDHATVPGVKVWIAEHPFTKFLNIRSDETGYWTIYLLKYRGVDLKFSFVYEKDGWVTTKSNVITIKDEDNLDLAIQYIDPLYYYLAVKPGVEEQLSSLFGFPVSIANAMIVTVGKSWASMYNFNFPHGDPGAIATLNPSVPAIGPIYFNENVQPDPSYTSTSVDGGVTWINIPNGLYSVSASKTGVVYTDVIFDINASDADNGVVLYIASPPDSVQGSNNSGPGEY